MGEMRLFGQGLNTAGALGDGEFQLQGDDRPPEAVLDLQPIAPLGFRADFTVRQSGFTLQPLAPLAFRSDLSIAPDFQPLAPLGFRADFQVLPGQSLSLALVAPFALRADFTAKPAQVFEFQPIAPMAFRLDLQIAPDFQPLAPLGFRADFQARPGQAFELQAFAPLAFHLEAELLPAGEPLDFQPIAPLALHGFEPPPFFALQPLAPIVFRAEFTATPAAGDDIGRALVVNLSTGHATRYEGFPQRRMFQAGTRAMGLNGETLEDLFTGDPAPWSFRTARALLSDDRVTIVDSLYLRVQGDGTATATITYDGDHGADFLTRLSDRAGFDVVRTKFGKGLRGHAADVRLSGTTAVRIRSLGLRLLGKGRKL